MARSDEFKSGGSNPAKYFLEWKSDDKQLAYYDKEKGENVLVKLPFSFLVLKQMNTVRGWDDKSKSGIFSNEVQKISSEKLVVKSYKGGTIAEGYYKDIKQAVNDAGGNYVRSIYIMTTNGEILNLQFKGSSVQAWGDFTQKALSRLGDEWVSITGAIEAKKGKVTYSTPVFDFSGSLTKDQVKLADEKYEIVLAHATGASAAVEHEEIENVTDSDLPF